MTVAVDTSLGHPVASDVMTTTSSEIAEIQQRNADGRKRVMDAASAENLAPTERIKAAMMELVAVWRDEANWWEASTKKGRLGTAKSIRDAATRLAGFAVNLTRDLSAAEYEIDAESPLSAPHVELSDEAKAVAAKLAAPIVDPLMDYLTGTSKTYEPTPRPEQVLDALKKEMPDVTAGPTAAQLVDSPFTSPAPPARRAPVAAVPFSALPALITHMSTGDAAREHVSHSYVSSYEGCSLSALLSDASRAGALGARKPSWSLIGGNAFHAAIETVERLELAGVHTDLASVEDQWNAMLDAQVKVVLDEMVGTPYADPSTWHVANGGREGFDWWRVEGVGMLKRYVEHHDEKFRARYQILRLGDGRPVIEWPYEMTVRTLDGSTGVTSKGFVDQAWRDVEADQVVVTDMKSGRSEPSETFQLGEYAHALVMELITSATMISPTITGRYWLARKGIYTDLVDVLAAHPLEELQFRYGQAMRGTQAGVFVPNRTNLCVSCGSRDYCPVGSR